MSQRAILIAGAFLIGGVLLYDFWQAKNASIAPSAPGPGTITSPAPITAPVSAEPILYGGGFLYGPPQGSMGVSGSF